MKKVVVTGFDPFNGEKINSSYEAIKFLEDRILDYDILKFELATEYKKSIKDLYKIIDSERPNIVILVGQAGGSSSIRLERMGINLRDARIEDNSGEIYSGQPIFEDGDDGYFSTLDLMRIEDRLKKLNIPVVKSNSAGTFVCNNLLYSLLYKIRKEKLNMVAGFIHVPYIPEQVIDRPQIPSMDLALISKALGEVIRESIIKDSSE